MQLNIHFYLTYRSDSEDERSSNNEDSEKYRSDSEDECPSDNDDSERYVILLRYVILALLVGNYSITSLFTIHSVSGDSRSPDAQEIERYT